jgi:hypothetical protein
MIIWSGAGIFVPIITIAFVAISTAASGPGADNRFQVLFSLVLSGVCCFFLDKFLRAKFTKTMVDRDTGQEFTTGLISSFFFIPMRFFIVILPVIGILQLFR